MPAKLQFACYLVLIACFVVQSAAAQSAIDAELRGLYKLTTARSPTSMRSSGSGADLLKRDEEPQDQQDLLHADARPRPGRDAAAGSDREVRPGGARLQADHAGPAATVYSYWGSAIEVQREAIKEFPERRKAAAEVMLKGLGELALLKIPEKEPARPLPPPGIEIGGDVPGEAPRPRAAAEAYQRARDEHERIRDLIFRRKVLTDQVRYLYVRDPANLEELRELATQGHRRSGHRKTRRRSHRRARAHRKGPPGSH